MSESPDGSPPTLGEGEITYERTAARAARIRDVLARRQPDLAIVMENVDDMHNVSAILRTCDAVGIPELYMVYTRHATPDFTRHGKRSSSGARKWVRTVPFPSAAECFEHLRGRGFRIVATQLAPDAESLYAQDFTRPTALVFGNEQVGVSPEASALADARLCIPMMGMVQSLNVSVAAAVSLYEAHRQRSAAGMYDNPGLSASEMEELERTWLKK